MSKSHKEIIEVIREAFSTSGFIPLHEPRFRGNEKKYLEACIDSTFVSSVGEYVNRFEKDLATYLNARRAVAIVNGTSALHLALKIAGVKHGEEVITQAFTFVATANAITYCNAHPVFLDVDQDTMGLSPDALRNFLDAHAEKRDEGTFNRKTGNRIAACVPMHTFGFMCRIDEIISICEQWNLPLVEDAAEALGSAYKGIKAGNFGELAAYSFNGNKIITSGGGGAIVSNDERLGEKAKYLSTTAKKPHSWAYFHDELGYNYRMPNLNAALLCAQMESLEHFVLEKRKLYAIYQNTIGEMLKPIPDGTDWNYWLMGIMLENKEERDAFLEITNKEGVMTRPAWQLLFELPMYRNALRDDQKNARYLAERFVNIPSSVI